VIIALGVVLFLMLTVISRAGTNAEYDRDKGRIVTSGMRTKIFFGKIARSILYIAMFVAVVPLLSALAHLIYNLILKGWYLI
jgi:hypothetical protein